MNPDPTPNPEAAAENVSYSEARALREQARAKHEQADAAMAEAALPYSAPWQSANLDLTQAEGAAVASVKRLLDTMNGLLSGGAVSITIRFQPNAEDDVR